MSANKRRQPVGPSYPKPVLRLVKSPEAPRQPAPDPELKAMLDEMMRRHPGRRVRIERGPDDKDAA